METVYIITAVAGGAILLIQIALMLFGLDADTDLDADVDIDGDFSGDVDGDIAGATFGQLGVKTVLAFLTFFGLAGLWGTSRGWGTTPTLGISVLAGAVAFMVVSFIMMQLHGLSTSGNVEIANAIGRPATVYTSVPENLSSTGAVIVEVQGRTMKYRAVTRGTALKTSQPCRVVGLHAGSTLVVEPVETEVPHA